MKKTFEYHSLKTGRTVQLLQFNGIFYTCLIDLTGEELQIIEAHDFTSLADASRKVTEIIKAQTHIDLKCQASRPKFEPELN